MSGSRQPDPALVRTHSVRYSPTTRLPPHTHDWGQLVYASEGVMTVGTHEGSWVVPPQRAVWIPPRVEHWIEMSGFVFMRSLYLVPQLTRSLPESCRVIQVSSLLKELILHVVRYGALQHLVAEHERLVGFLLDQLQTVDAVPLELPMPRDPRALRLAERLRENPGEQTALEELARGVGASARTLERLFRSETGLTFGRWRQQLRLLEALRLIASGRAITTVALDVGYESPSAFISMFKSALGTTPGRYYTPLES